MGVIVEEARLGFAGATAGVVPGDVIFGWSRTARPSTHATTAGGSIATPFDLVDVETEQAPRGVVTLFGRRDGRDISWILPSDAWRILAHVPLAPEVRTLYEEGAHQFKAQRLEEGALLWQNAARLAMEQQDPRLAAWLLLRAADTVTHGTRRELSDGLYRRSVEHLDNEVTPLERAQTLTAWARSLVSRGSYEHAIERYEQALQLIKRSRGQSLTLARALHELGRAEYKDGNDSSAEGRYREALAIRENVAPESAAVADSLSALGTLMLGRKNLAAAEKYLTQALQLRGSPRSLAYAADLSVLAVLAAQSGDYVEASQRLSAALSVLETLAPSGEEMAYALLASQQVAFFTGNLATAELHARRALEITRRLSGEDRRFAFALNALSHISWSRRDYAQAADLGKQALAVLERVAPETPLVGEVLHHLGDIAVEEGDLQGAEYYLGRALNVNRAHSPDGLRVANDLRCLGLTLARSGRLEEGEAHAAQSTEIRRGMVPDTHELSKSLMALAEIARLRGRLTVAANHYKEALNIRRKVVPGTREEAEAHHGLGLVWRQAGDRVRAVESFEHAIDALELQRIKLGGTEEAGGGFSAAYTHYYQDAIEGYVALGRVADAFHTLERSRVRSLLAMLAERNIAFGADLPPDLARERLRNHVDYDRTQARLSQLSSGRDSAEIERLFNQLRRLRVESADIAARLRAVSPRFASLHHPEPLDAVTASRALDPGTVLLSYAVGESGTLLFVLRATTDVGPDNALRAFTLPIGEQSLRDRVNIFRRVIAERGLDQEVINEYGRDLYDLLLRPAETIVASGKRIAISPDGPLHLLPFSALVRAEAPRQDSARQWLVEWMPLHIVASATHFAELKARRRDARTDRRLFAFGDPSPHHGATAATELNRDPDLALPDRRGFHLGPLPSARREVEAIGRLFKERSVVYIGSDATEARAKVLPLDASYVHFACHALINEAFPVNSALVLAVPESASDGAENGLLQVWEIFETVRLDADLVTLSACDTAVGEEIGGEGLMSLTRAFQYAGARSVLASLWQVQDDSTADLMVRFYSRLKDTQSKVDALRLAQAGFTQSQAEAAHPFRWAAFAVFGDWR